MSDGESGDGQGADEESAGGNDAPGEHSEPEHDSEREEDPKDGAAGRGDDDRSRRRFLAVGIGSLGAGVAAISAAPGVMLLGYPLQHETTGGSDAFLPAGRADAFKPGKPVKVDLYADRVDAWNRVTQVKVGSAWVVKEGKDLFAYTTVCPHLGCAVDWDGDASKFKCPCHRSAFSPTGEVEAGPSPRPLDRLDVEVKDGLLAVRYQRFRQGVGDKVPT